MCKYDSFMCACSWSCSYIQTEHYVTLITFQQHGHSFVLLWSQTQEQIHPTSDVWMWSFSLQWQQSIDSELPNPDVSTRLYSLWIQTPALSPNPWLFSFSSRCCTVQYKSSQSSLRHLVLDLCDSLVVFDQNLQQLVFPVEAISDLAQLVRTGIESLSRVCGGKERNWLSWHDLFKFDSMKLKEKQVKLNQVFETLTVSCHFFNNTPSDE